MGSSSLVMTATAADFDNPATAGDLEQFLGNEQASARERVQVMKLAWDAVAGEFGGRQEIYEIFLPATRSCRASCTTSRRAAGSTRPWSTGCCAKLAPDRLLFRFPTLRFAASRRRAVAGDLHARFLNSERRGTHRPRP